MAARNRRVSSKQATGTGMSTSTMASGMTDRAFGQRIALKHRLVSRLARATPAGRDC